MNWGFRWMAASVVMMFVAIALRYGLIEPRKIGAVCQVGFGPWWCGLRMVVIRVFQSGILGGGSVAFAFVAVVAGDRALGRVAAVLALTTGAAGLVLYNAGLASVGYLLGLITVARFQRTLSQKLASAFS